MGGAEGRTEQSASASTTRAGSRSFRSGGLRHGRRRGRRRSQRSSPAPAGAAVPGGRGARTASHPGHPSSISSHMSPVWRPRGEPRCSWYDRVPISDGITPAQSTPLWAPNW